MPSGTLYIVATPIGNLGDITHRAVEVLKAVPAVAAEDTRRTRILLEHLGIGTVPRSLPAFDERARAGGLLQRVEQGEDLALVTDAGTPGVSDPGGALVAEAVKRGIPVVPIPGACAAVAAVSVAALRSERFCFLGFLPRKGPERSRLLGVMAPLPMSMVIYEAPNRVAETLADLLAAWGDRPALVARELTKIHEELVRGSLSELAGRGEESWRGEVVMVVEGADPATQTLGDPADLELELKRLLQDGTRPIEEIARQLADSAGVSRKMVYDLALKLEGKK